MKEYNKLAFAAGVTGIITCTGLAFEHSLVGVYTGLNQHADESIVHAAWAYLDVAAIPTISSLVGSILTHRDGGDPPSGSALS